MGTTSNPGPGGVSDTDSMHEVAVERALRERTGTPFTDAFRAWVRDASLEDKQKFIDDMNGIAGGLRVLSEARAEQAKDEGDLATGLVDFATFIRTDLRTGTVVKAEWVPKSDKLLRLEIDFGELGTRVILAGIAQSYTVDGIVGQAVVAVVNLPPRKMMGQESNGMLLAAKAADGKVILASCSGVPNGSRLG